MRKWILPAVAVIGLCAGIWMLSKGNPEVKKVKLVAEPAQAPYPSYVAGTGLIESPTTNVAVATNVSGVVREVFVQVGQQVRRGQPLFRLDDMVKQAEMTRQKVAVRQAELKLAKLELGTRPEEVASQQAQVSQARVQLEEARKQLALRTAVLDARAISRDEVLQQESNVRQKEEQLKYAERQLQLLEAGSWKPDVEIARAELEAARTQLRQLEVDLERLLVRAPMDGEILQVNLHPGEFANAAGGGTPPLLMGNTQALHVRAEVDENDAWRVNSKGAAMAYPRGRRDVALPLHFVRIEPYVSSKRNLTGESTERVDTRVLQVLYQFSSPDLKLYVGQQMDVYIQADPLPDPGTSPKKPVIGQGAGL